MTDLKEPPYPPRLAITVEPSDVYDPTGKMWMERCEELEQRDIDAVYWENECNKLSMQLKDAKSFAKRCANSPVGQMIKQLDAVRESLRDCNYTDCGCCNAVRQALGEDNAITKP